MLQLSAYRESAEANREWEGWYVLVRLYQLFLLRMFQQLGKLNLQLKDLTILTPIPVLIHPPDSIRCQSSSLLPSVARIKHA